MDARGTIASHAAALGFSAVRFARVGEHTPAIERFDQWLSEGRHGVMGFAERGRDDRADPRRRFRSARSAVVLALDYHHPRPPDPGGRTGRVARYAWGRDYHNLIDKRLKKLRRRLKLDGIAAWGGVDAAPILERGWAAAAGLGFAGKNTLQILPATTSWFFLAVLFVDVDVAPDPPMGDHCGSCTRCLVACPTDAFVGPHQLDARRCIAYWTIEDPGLAPRELRPAFGRWMFGCDDCQEVCPHNVGVDDSDEADFRPRHAWLDLDDILATPDDALMERFLGTPLRRPKAAGLKRNALYVLANLGDDRAVDAIRPTLLHPSPVVRGAAVWALKRLGAQTPTTDPDPLVQNEIR